MSDIFKMVTLNLTSTVNSLTDFIRQAFKEAGFTEAVIALSGGIDSATSCALAARALGNDHVYPLLLPYGQLNPAGVTDARDVIASLQIPENHVKFVDIKPLVDPFFALDPGMDNIRRGNVMARTRMIVVFDYAKKLPGLVVGTENKTEHLLGYYTRFGDEGSDLEPLRNLYKTQVYQVAKFLGLPEVILTKKPTAGLWEGQTDEGEFGFTYKDADEILSLSVDGKNSKEDIVGRGYSQEIVDKVLSRMHANAFKHNLPLLPSDF